MQKLKMKATETLTFQEGCERYLEYCRQRNLREGTINHYRQSYTQFYKFFNPETPIEEFDEDAYKRYVARFILILQTTAENKDYIKKRCNETAKIAYPFTRKKHTWVTLIFL